MREVIYADHRGGKTTKLVEIIRRESNALIAVESESEISRLQRKYDLSRDRIVTYENIMRGSRRTMDRNVQIYIDDLDKFLQYTVGNVQVAGITVQKDGVPPLWDTGILEPREEGVEAEERFRNIDIDPHLRYGGPVFMDEYGVRAIQDSADVRPSPTPRGEHVIEMTDTGDGSHWRVLLDDEELYYWQHHQAPSLARELIAICRSRGQADRIIRDDVALAQRPQRGARGLRGINTTTSTASAAARSRIEEAQRAQIEALFRNQANSVWATGISTTTSASEL